MRLFFLVAVVMNASQVEADDVFSCLAPFSNPPRGGPDLQLDLPK